MGSAKVFERRPMSQFFRKTIYVLPKTRNGLHSVFFVSARFKLAHPFFLVRLRDTYKDSKILEFQGIWTDSFFVNVDFVIEDGSPCRTVNPVIGHSDEILDSKNNLIFPRSCAYHTCWACARSAKIKFEFAHAVWAEEQKAWKFIERPVNSRAEPVCERNENGVPSFGELGPRCHHRVCGCFGGSTNIIKHYCWVLRCLR